MAHREESPRRRAAVVLGLALAAAAFAGLLGATPLAVLVDARLYDLTVTRAPPPPPDDLVVVAVDEPSFSVFGDQWPWPRDRHAALLRALRGAGAKAVGLDMIFAEATDDPAEDAALAGALGPDVVLASDETLVDDPQALSLVRTEPLPAFTEAGARSGLASVLLDADGALRRVPPYDDGFARRLVEASGGITRTVPPDALMMPFGPARTIRTVSYYQALEPETHLPPDFFRGKTVVVGLSLQAAPSADEGGADAFATPFTTLTHRLTPGVELQATAFDALRTGRFVRPLGPAGEAGLAAAAALLAALAALRRTSWRTLGAAAALAAALAGGSALLLFGAHVWASPAAPTIAAALALGLAAGRDFVHERRLRQQIVHAFRHYLAPDLVDRLARDPAALKLGGERRTLTLLFCDVRGFTTIAEAMKDEPERLTALVNRLLDPLAKAVLDHGGTIDKYMGDCVMAFWNAPLDDPDHARHAAEAALAMVRAADALNAALAAEAAAGAAAPRIAVGVGLNTGDVVVGNMGSSSRFDYTAIGDAVNLASRLESLSKDYGVPVVLSAETRSRLPAALPTLTLDRIAVRGRAAPTTIATLADPSRPPAPDLLALHEAVVADALDGRPAADDGRLARLREALPELATVYRRLAAASGGREPG